MSKPHDDEQLREVDITCNWCSAMFTYRAKLGEAHGRTACPWCHQAVHVPHDRLRPVNVDRGR
jgi:hypothetical protein